MLVAPVGTLERAANETVVGSLVAKLVVFDVPDGDDLRYSVGILLRSVAADEEVDEGTLVGIERLLLFCESVASVDGECTGGAVVCCTLAYGALVGSSLSARASI